MRKQLALLTIVLSMLVFTSCFLFKDKLYIQLNGWFAYGGNSFLRGGEFEISWDAPSYVPYLHIDLMRENSSYKVRIAEHIPNNGSYIWSIPEDLEINEDYYIKIYGTETQSVKNPEARTQGCFSIINLKVIKPTSETVMETGYIYLIEWETSGISYDYIDMALTNTEDGKDFQTYALPFSDKEYILYILSNTPPGEYIIRFYDSKNVQQEDNQIKNSIDSEPFTIRTGMGAKWEQVLDVAPWSPRYYYANLVYDDKIWVIGGYELIEEPDGEITRITKDDVWNSPDGITWTQVTDDLPMSERSGAEALVYNSEIWRMGGLGSDDIYYNDVWHSSDGITWTEATDYADWVGRRSFASLVFDDKIWVMAGRGYSNQYFNDVWYSSDGVYWTKACDAPWCSREDPGVVVYDGKMWVTGGLDEWDKYYNDVWVSDDGINWTSLSYSSYWYERKGHQMLGFNDQMWIMGGYNFFDDDPYYYNDIWHSEDGEMWAHIDPIDQWIGRVGFGALVFNDDIWVLSGYNKYIVVNDIWKTIDEQ